MAHIKGNPIKGHSGGERLKIRGKWYRVNAKLGRLTPVAAGNLRYGAGKGKNTVYVDKDDKQWYYDKGVKKPFTGDLAGKNVIYKQGSKLESLAINQVKESKIQRNLSLGINPKPNEATLRRWQGKAEDMSNEDLIKLYQGKVKESGSISGTGANRDAQAIASILEARGGKRIKGTTNFNMSAAKDEALVSGTNKALQKKADQAVHKLSLDKNPWSEENRDTIAFSKGLKDGTIDVNQFSSKWVKQNFNLDGHWDGKIFVPHSKGDKKGNNKLDFKTSLDAETLGTGAKVNEEGEVEIPKKSWSDIKGMKRGRERDKLAIEYFKDKGIDFKAKGRHRQSEIAKDLYIDNRVFVKDKGWTSIEDVEEGEKSTYHTRSDRGPSRTYSSY